MVVINFLAPLTIFALPIMKNVPTLLMKSVLVPLRLIVAMLVTYAAIPNKFLGSGALIVFSSEELDDIKK